MSTARVLLLLAVTTFAAFLYGIWSLGESPMKAVLLGLAPVALAVGVRWPAVVLAGLVIVTSGEINENLANSFGLPVLDMAAAGGLLVLGLRYLIYGAVPRLAAPALVGFGVLLLWSASGILYSDNWQVTRSTTVAFAKDIAVVLLILCFVDRPAMLRAFILTSLSLFALVSALGIYRYATGSEETFFGLAGIAFAERRFTGHYPDANFFASYIVLLVPICLGAVLGSSSRRWIVAGSVCTGLLIASLLLTGSRGGILALMLCLPLFFIYVGDRARLWILAGCAVGAVLFTTLQTEQLKQRFDFLVEPSVAAPTADRAVEGRLASWQVAVDLFKHHPLAGVGAGNFNTYYQDTALNLGLIFRGEGRSAHSLYLEVLSEQGLVGLILLLAMLATAVAIPLRMAGGFARDGRQKEAMELRGFAIGVLGMLAARAFLHDDYPLLLWTVIGIALSLSVIYRDRARLPSTSS